MGSRLLRAILQDRKAVRSAMALRIWCNPTYFPKDTQQRAVQAALEVLSSHDVTLEQAREGYAAAERLCDLPQAGHAVPLNLRRWHDAWFEAMEAAEAVAGAGTRTPMGSMLVLDETDERFSETMPRSLH